ncbi:MAG TPA: hypothetical protein VFH42_05125, partial [Sporolactobacillaceae bacterium]|nr:hypothetical protein [Sporolactobacillaceae bacterium]
FMSYQFLVSNENHSEVKKGKTLWSAVRTIIIADALMGLDNVLAIAGAAGHNYILIIIGLLISVPLVMRGSSLFIKLMDRHPWIVFAGSGLLALTAGKMIVAEPIIHSWFPEEYYAWMVVLGIGLCVVSAGWVKLRVLRRRENQCMES